MSPTYRNNTSIKQELGGKIVEPNKEICSLLTYNERNINLQKVSDKPFYNTTILSSIVQKNCEVVLPLNDNIGIPVNKFAIHFYVESGEVEIRYNSELNEPSLKLYKGCKWNIRVFERYINSIFVQSNSIFKLWIIVEKLS